MATTSVAFLLVKLRGDAAEPITRASAEQMLTATGRGTLNVVEWFDDNTHGRVDMSGNAVFGWLDLNESLAEYTTKRQSGQYGRTKIVDLARAAAAAAGIDLAPFAMTVVVTNVDVDLYGGTGYACCSAVTAGRAYWEMHVAPSVLCQEMIHGLGISEHARRDGSDADYTDPYDVMSMFAAVPGRHPDDANRPVGPGLNAAFMDRCGWLDTSRAATAGGQIVLRPLHRRDLQGPLYARVGVYYVEYRASQRWDTGFPGVVLVHRQLENTSYLSAELRQGDPAFTFGDPGNPFEAYGSVRVDLIDDKNLTATITTSSRVARPTPVTGPAISLTGGEQVDGGGLVIIGGRLIRVPPRSPAMRMLESVEALAHLDHVPMTPANRVLVLGDVYAGALRNIEDARAHVTGPHSVLDHMTIDDAQRFHRDVVPRLTRRR